MEVFFTQAPDQFINHNYFLKSALQSNHKIEGKADRENYNRNQLHKEDIRVVGDRILNYSEGTNAIKVFNNLLLSSLFINLHDLLKRFPSVLTFQECHHSSVELSRNFSRCRDYYHGPGGNTHWYIFIYLGEFYEGDLNGWYVFIGEDRYAYGTACRNKLEGYGVIKTS